jgi:hypothetical protein
VPYTAAFGALRQDRTHPEAHPPPAVSPASAQWSATQDAAPSPTRYSRPHQGQPHPPHSRWLESEAAGTERASQDAATSPTAPIVYSQSHPGHPHPPDSCRAQRGERQAANGAQASQDAAKSPPCYPRPQQGQPGPPQTPWTERQAAAVGRASRDAATSPARYAQPHQGRARPPHTPWAEGSASSSTLRGDPAQEGGGPPPATKASGRVADDMWGDAENAGPSRPGAGGESDWEFARPISPYYDPLHDRSPSPAERMRGYVYPGAHGHSGGRVAGGSTKGKEAYPARRTEDGQRDVIRHGRGTSREGPSGRSGDHGEYMGHMEGTWSEAVEQRPSSSHAFGADAASRRQGGRYAHTNRPGDMSHHTRTDGDMGGQQGGEQDEDPEDYGDPGTYDERSHGRGAPRRSGRYGAAVHDIDSTSPQRTRGKSYHQTWSENHVSNRPPTPLDRHPTRGAAHDSKTMGETQQTHAPGKWVAENDAAWADPPQGRDGDPRAGPPHGPPSAGSSRNPPQQANARVHASDRRDSPGDARAPHGSGVPGKWGSDDENQYHLANAAVPGDAHRRRRGPGGKGGRGPRDAEHPGDGEQTQAATAQPVPKTRRQTPAYDCHGFTSAEAAMPPRGLEARRVYTHDASGSRRSPLEDALPVPDMLDHRTSHRTPHAPTQGGTAGMHADWGNDTFTTDAGARPRSIAHPDAHRTGDSRRREEDRTNLRVRTSTQSRPDWGGEEGLPVPAPALADIQADLRRLEQRLAQAEAAGRPASAAPPRSSATRTPPPHPRPPKRTSTPAAPSPQDRGPRGLFAPKSIVSNGLGAWDAGPCRGVSGGASAAGPGGAGGWVDGESQPWRERPKGDGRTLAQLQADLRALQRKGSHTRSGTPPLSPQTLDAVLQRVLSDGPVRRADVSRRGIDADQPDYAGFGEVGGGGDRWLGGELDRGIEALRASMYEKERSRIQVGAPASRLIFAWCTSEMLYDALLQCLLNIGHPSGRDIRHVLNFKRAKKESVAKHPL